MMEGKEDKSVIFWKPNTPPQLNMLHVLMNFSLSFFWTLGFLHLALHDYVLENHAMAWDTLVMVDFYGWLLCNNHECYKYYFLYNNTWLFFSLHFSIFFSFILFLTNITWTCACYQNDEPQIYISIDSSSYFEFRIK